MLSTLWEVPQLYNAIRAFARAASAGVCALCAGPGPSGRFCDACCADLPRARADLRPSAQLSAIHAAFDYVFPMAGLLRAAKFHADLAVLGALAHAFADSVSGSLPAVDVAVPIPLPLGRYVHRGYNQTVLLSVPLVARCECLLLPHALSTRGGRPTQSTLGRAERQRSIAGAFQASRRFDGLRVLLIDDVVTTGATLAAAASTLRAAGARDVVAATLAATPRDRPVRRA